MFKLVRSVVNNVSERKYIKASGNLNVKKVDSSSDTNNPTIKIDENRVLRELESLETTIRHENLRVFVRNIVPCRLKQFFLYSVPAIIVAGAITLFVLPSTRVKTENLETFRKEEVIFVDGKQISVQDDTTYYGVYFNRTFVEPNKDNVHPLEGSNMEFYITENLEGFKIKAGIDSNKELSIKEATKGEFADLKDYDESKLVEMEPKYVELFNKVVDLVLDSSYFGNKDDERLKTISDSEKSHIVGSLVTYYSTGYEDVDVVKSNWWWRIAILVVLGLYDWLIIYLKNEQYCFESRKVTERNGELDDTSETYDISLFNLALKYKEAFMDAEEKRIKRIHKLLEDNFEEGSVDKVLTNYEKKLVLK